MGICVSHLNHQYKIEIYLADRPEDILQQNMGDWQTTIVKSVKKNSQGKRLVITTRKFLFCDELWDEIKSYYVRNVGVLEPLLRKQSLRFLGDFMNSACNTYIKKVQDTDYIVSYRKDVAIRAIMKYHYKKHSVFNRFKQLEPPKKERKVMDFTGNEVGKMVRYTREKTLPNGSRVFKKEYGRIIKNTGKSVTIEFHEHILHDAYFRQNQTLGNAEVTLLPFTKDRHCVRHPISPYDIHHDETTPNKWHQRVDYGN